MPVYNAIKAIFMFLSVPKTQFIIYRPDLHNSKASRKKLKKQLMVEINFIPMSKPKIPSNMINVKVSWHIRNMYNFQTIWKTGK